VFSKDHPPPHIHVDFLDGKAPVRVGWPSLEPLKHDRGLTSRQRRDLNNYMELYELKILKRIRMVFSHTSLKPAIG